MYVVCVGERGGGGREGERESKYSQPRQTTDTAQPSDQLETTKFWF